MKVRFRGITHREIALIDGPCGWGEFAPFPEYEDAECRPWLHSAVEMAWSGPPPALRNRIEINATVPAVEAGEVAELLARFPGCQTVKVKVAEKGESLRADTARVAAVRAASANAVIRVDANGGWSVSQALDAARELSVAAGGLEYMEQPCRSVSEMVELRRMLLAKNFPVKVAADESIRRSDDPARVVRAGGADIAVVKAAPLGGPRRLVAIAAELGIPIVVSSALDSAVGIGAGLAAAAALPSKPPACGLGTGGFFHADVSEPRSVVGGYLDCSQITPDPARMAGLAADPPTKKWWVDRISRVYRLSGRSLLVSG